METLPLTDTSLKENQNDNFLIKSNGNRTKTTLVF